MAEPEEQAQEQEPQKKSKLKLIIIMVLALGILGGGGFFAYTKFFAKKEKEAEEEQVKIPQVVTYQLDTFLVNLADPGGKRYLKLTVELELDNPKVIEEINKENFKIRDAILLILSSKEFDDISTVGGKLALKKEIMAKLNSILKTGRVLNIYFTEFLVQ